MRSDAELLAAQLATRCVPRALRALRGRVHGYHLRRSGDPDAAHDLTAETFAQAWLSRRRFRDQAGGSAGPWLFGIARHVLLSRCAAGGSSAARASASAASSGSTGAPAPRARRAWLDGLDEAFADLPEAQREAIRLRVVDDLAVRRGRRAARHDAAGARACASRAACDALRNRLRDRTEALEMNDHELDRLGDALERAASGGPRRASARRRRRRRGSRSPPRVLAVAVPGVAFAATS